LNGHTGPVWQVSWAHPKFDNVLASCSYDKRVIVWKEISGKWQRIYEWNHHDASVNSISWAPHQFGLTLACASTDTAISLLIFNKAKIWTHQLIAKAHEQGCNAVSWAPAMYSTSLIHSDGPVLRKRVVSGGNDNFVKIWREKKDGIWELEIALEGHTDWVRDVAWAPVAAHNVNTIASCGQDRKVIIWRCSSVDQRWSLCATVLAVSGGDNVISLWKENIQNEWICISEPEEKLEMFVIQKKFDVKMFKKFDEKEDIIGTQQLKSSAQKSIRSKIVDQLPLLDDYINDILPKKDSFKLIKCKEHVELIADCEGKILFIKPRDV
uniref:Protein SEC13 homolog n=1 Tax=Brugia timori TaxID=42155 RepID=A0A0R3R780_9BILA